MTPRQPLLELTAEDVMARDLRTVPEEMSLRDAAHVLRRAGVGGAPVVDAAGRCVGVISGFDLLRWAEGDAPADRTRAGRACPYLVKGHAASGCDGWLCVLSEGGCPFQATQPTTGGRHVSLCLRAAAGDWPTMEDRLPPDSVCRYMTTDVVTAGRRKKLPELARRMVEAGVHRLVILDEAGRPVGVVSGTCLLAALAAESSLEEAPELAIAR
jgi:CBS-domain-containing membrane protein